MRSVSEKNKKEIIAKYLAGASIAELARNYSILYQTIRPFLIKIAPPARKRGQHRLISDKERFFERVGNPDNNGCWPWEGAVINKRYKYGSFFFRGRKTTAQRVSYILHIGEIPAELEVDHTCNNPNCVNPAHLQAITKSQNLSKRSITKKICWRGHPLSGDNVVLEKEGKVRRCKICRKRSRTEVRRDKEAKNAA